MASTPLKAVAGFVVLLAVAQVAFENVVLFLGASGAVSGGTAGPPAVMVAVPLLISFLLLVVLVGGALARTDTLR